MKDIDIKLSNGEIIKFNPTNDTPFFSAFVEKFLKPLYESSNDWNLTLMESLNETERVSVIYNLMKRNEMNAKLLNIIDKHLARDIAELTGTDQIEIIFEGLEDYVGEIMKTVNEGASQEEIRLQLSAIVENLNLFEISELMIYFARKCSGNE